MELKEISGYEVMPLGLTDTEAVSSSLQVTDGLTYCEWVESSEWEGLTLQVGGFQGVNHHYGAGSELQRCTSPFIGTVYCVEATPTMGASTQATPSFLGTISSRLID